MRCAHVQEGATRGGTRAPTRGSHCARCKEAFTCYVAQRNSPSGPRSSPVRPRSRRPRTPTVWVSTCRSEARATRCRWATARTGAIGRITATTGAARTSHRPSYTLHRRPASSIARPMYAIRSSCAHPCTTTTITRTEPACPPREGALSNASSRGASLADGARLRVASAAIPHAVDGPRGVVRDEQRAVGRDGDVRRASPRALALQPALGKRLVGDGPPVIVEAHQRDAIADLAAAVPRAVLGDEDLAAISRRKLRSRVETHAERRDVRAEGLRRWRERAARLPAAELRIGNRARVAVREAEIPARARRLVERVGRHVVAHHVAPVVGEPQRARARIPVEAYAVAYAARIWLEARAVRVHAHDARVTVAILLAHVAWRAHGHVQLAVGAEGDELPPVMTIGRKAVRYDHALRRAIETPLDVVEAQDRAHRRDVEGAVAKRDADGLAQAGRDRAHGCGAIGPGGFERDRIHVAAYRADEQRAVIAERHLARTGRTRDELDRESFWQSDLVERQALCQPVQRRRREDNRCGN